MVSRLPRYVFTGQGERAPDLGTAGDVVLDGTIRLLTSGERAEVAENEKLPRVICSVTHSL